MKKALFLILLLVLLFVFASCSEKGINMFFKIYDNEKVADTTFYEKIDAIEQRNDSKIVMMFAKAIQNEKTLSQDAVRLIDSIHGDITSISSASDTGVNANYEKNKGKKKKEIQSSFCITTAETKYYMAIKECVIDDYDNNNEGVLSVYIIKAEDWKEDCVYIGDGKWTPGITIDGR